MSLTKLHPRLQDYVKNKKWGDLTPIQKQAFDPIFNGKSCTLEAPTSGGKTEAVLFPLLTRISASKTSGFKVLYIAPLKALLNDLALRVVPYAKMCYLEAFKWHGDVSQGDKIQQMAFPADILMTTPESIEAILLRKAKWANVFKNLETIVIDEAHYFALTERGSHLISLLERIESEIKKHPQRIAVTATIGNPEELLSWLMSGRTGAISLSASSTIRKEKDFKIYYFGDNGPTLQDSIYQLLTKQRKSIVFERSRSLTEETATRINKNQLNNTRIPLKVRTHHSSVSKQLREDAETSIKQNSENLINAIISTSTLELGIDIGELDQVIQVGGLNSSSSFLQRVGRTGRRTGRPQFFRGLCSEPEDLLLLAGCVNLGLKGISERILFPTKAFHILAHQIICLCLQKSGAADDDIWKTVSKAFCFSTITRKEFDSLISHMLKEEFLRTVSEHSLVTSNKTEGEFLRANWKRLFAIFDTGPMYNVVDGKRIIGTLDSGFARRQTLPFVFVLGGHEWNALKLDHELQQVRVERNETGTAPSWTSIGAFDVPFELAQEIGSLLMSEQRLDFLDASAQKILQIERNTHVDLQWESDKWILQSSYERGHIYLWTFAGDKINRSLASLFSTMIETEPKYDYMKITINAGKENPISSPDIHKLITTIKTKTSEELQITVEKKTKAVWFSKFYQCLPEQLAKKTIVDKDTDIAGLLRELSKGKIEIDE